jgi:hypothetical protein
MKTVLILSLVIAISMLTSVALPADFSQYSTEELAAMRGTMQNLTEEERADFRTEWQKRLQSMPLEDRQQYSRRPYNTGSQSGKGMMQRKRRGRGMRMR